MCRNLECGNRATTKRDLKVIISEGRSICVGFISAITAMYHGAAVRSPGGALDAFLWLDLSRWARFILLELEAVRITYSV